MEDFDLHGFRQHLRDMTDKALAQAYRDGPEGYRVAEAWAAVEQEYLRRAAETTGPMDLAEEDPPSDWHADPGISRARKSYWRRPGTWLQALLILTTLSLGLGALEEARTARLGYNVLVLSIQGLALLLACAAIWFSKSGGAVWAARGLIVAALCALAPLHNHWRGDSTVVTVLVSALFLVFLFKSTTVREEFGPVTWSRIMFQNRAEPPGGTTT